MRSKTKTKLTNKPPIRFTARKFNGKHRLISVVWIDHGERVKINRNSQREVIVNWEVPVPENSQGVTAYYDVVRFKSETPIAIEFLSGNKHYSDREKPVVGWRSRPGRKK
ncbi:MAG TPA: hypothetical protein VHA06_07040 [Candidatus Angelobacter sp.]|jgi:hypothetical protein|nr:hypothetical protein [Candidatus Angelobacter sp.]